MFEIYEEEKAYICRLREVETKIQVLSKRKRTYEKDVDYLRRPYVTPELPRKPVINTLEIMEEAALVLCIIGIFFMCALSSGKVVVVLCIGAVTFAAYLCYVFLRTNRERIRYKSGLAEYKRICERNEQRLKANNLVVEAKLHEIDAINKELKKLLSEREWLYAESHMPVSCRNIRSIYYIHDMVVNEKISMSEVVANIESDGLGVLVEKYDEAVQAECLRHMRK